MANRTHAQQFDEALACNTAEEAAKWLETEVEFYIVAYPDKYTNDKEGREKALDVIKQNLGYMAGYYNHETAQKIDRLFGATHPIFGTSTYFKDVTPEQAFEMGQKWGEGEK